MEIFLSILIIVALVIIFLGLLVYFKGRDKKPNQIFLLITLSTLIWIIGIMSLFFLYKLPEKQMLILGRIPFSSAIFLSWLLFYFAQVFPKRTILVPNLVNLLALFLCSIFIYFSLLTPLVLKSIIFQDTFPIAVFGPLILLFGLVFILFSAGALAILIFKYKLSKGVEKMQIFYLFLGLALSIISGSLTNLVLPQINPAIRLYHYGPVGIIFFIIFTTLAITRYHLFGIEVILTEILVLLIGILLIIQIFVAPSIFWKITNSIIFILFSIGGGLLIRYTFREIKRREEAEKLSKAKSEFLSIASHQLRTPLTAIKGYLSMILEGSYGEIEEKVKRVIQNVYQSNERLIKLVNDFLQASKIETGKMELELEKTDLERLVEDIVSELKIKAQAKGLYLTVKKPKEKIPQVLIDKEKIRQVLTNLIDNGIKYTYKGGIIIDIQNEKKLIRISIKDTGEGLEKRELEKLFESFSRGSAGEKFFVEGAGLGLYIAKKLVELHKGKIWAESEGKRKGSTFHVELPLK